MQNEENVKLGERFVLADATELPFDNQSFDIIYTSCSIFSENSVRNLDQREFLKLAVLEAQRVLKSGGTFLIIDANEVEILKEFVEQMAPTLKLHKMHRNTPSNLYSRGHIRFSKSDFFF